MDVLSEQSFPHGQWLELARRGLKREGARRDRRRKCGVGGQHDAGELTVRDDTRVIGGEAANIGRLEQSVGVLREQNARIGRECSTETQAQPAPKLSAATGLLNC